MTHRQFGSDPVHQAGVQLPCIERLCQPQFTQKEILMTTYTEWFEDKVNEALTSNKPTSQHSVVMERLRNSINDRKI